MEEDRYWGRLVWDLLESGQKHGQEQLLTGRRIRFHQYHIGEDILRRGSMGGETVHHSFGAFLVPTRDDYVDAHCVCFLRWSAAIMVSSIVPSVTTRA